MKMPDRVKTIVNQIGSKMIVHNEKRYARVSEVLSCFSDFSHIDPEVLQNKANIGTKVHKAIEDDIGDVFPTLDARTIGYFESYKAWKQETSPKFDKSEQRFYCHEKMITGQIDSLVHYGWSFQVPVMVDFKTSVQESKVVWPMQAHLYAYLLAVNGISVQPRYLFIKLNKFGKLPEVFEYFWDPNIHAKCMDEFWKKNQ